MSRNKGHEPVRTCISCGSKHRKKELIRLILDEDNRVFIDESMSSPGRGAYLCKDKACLQRVKGRKINHRRLLKAFKTERPVAIPTDLDMKAGWKIVSFGGLHG
jgi:predicted RNA-binding protein YlxR (DUF448 family)